MKSFMLQLCSCLFLFKSELFVTGQYYDQQNDWSWIEMQDQAHLAPENEDEFHEHFHHSEDSPHIIDSAPKHHSIAHINLHNNPDGWWENYKNIEPLENIFKEEEQDHDIYNKGNLFKIGEEYAPPKPQEPRNEVIVDDVYEQHTEKSEVPSHVAAGFGEVVDDKSPSEKSPQMFDTFSVEKSHTFIGPENKVQEEDIEEIVMHVVEPGNDYNVSDSVIEDMGQNDNTNADDVMEEEVNSSNSNDNKKIDGDLNAVTESSVSSKSSSSALPENNIEEEQSSTISLPTEIIENIQGDHISQSKEKLQEQESSTIKVEN